MCRDEGQEGRGYVKKKKRAWVGWQPRDEDARNEFKKKVVHPKEDVRKDSLETIQRNSEDAAKEAAHTTKLEKGQGCQTCAVESCSRRRQRGVPEPDERRVLRRQVPKARAEHLVKCSLAGKR